MDDDALYARVDEVLGQNQAEIQRRHAAPYDGVMGTLPDWMPANFHREFDAIRGRLLATYSRADLLDYVAEMRDMGMLGNRDAGEFAELVSLADDLETTSPSGMLTGTYSRPRTPFKIMADVSTLAQIQEAVRLGPVEGLALLTDQEHAKTATIGANNRIEQSKKAKLLRGKVGDGGETNSQIIGRLALAREYRELGAKELLMHYISELDRLGLDPKETPAGDDWKKLVIEYSFKEGRKKITGGQFAGVVSDYRTGKKSG
jgi:hypothetical protein